MVFTEIVNSKHMPLYRKMNGIVLRHKKRPLKKINQCFIFFPPPPPPTTKTSQAFVAKGLTAHHTHKVKPV